MAGSSVVVRFLGDLLGLQKAASDAANVGQNAAGKMASAFHGVIGTLNQTGVLGPFSGALDGIGTRSTPWRPMARAPEPSWPASAPG